MFTLKKRWLQIRQTLRWACGLGWDKRDFYDRYKSNDTDSWHYSSDRRHHERRKRIIDSFASLQNARILELGCAEGFLTKALAEFGATVIACDLSPVAVERTSQICQQLNVEVVCCDIREYLPEGPFDFILASDVLYYLTKDEILTLAQKLSALAHDQSYLILANEWNPSYKRLTSPESIIEALLRSGNWDLQEKQTIFDEPPLSHTIARFQNKQQLA